MRVRRVRLKCGYALGDIIALTGAVRELHEQYPGAFVTDVETSAEEVWWHNPYITQLHTSAQVIDCNRVSIDHTGSRGQHYIGAYLDLLNAELGTDAKLRRVAGDIHLSAQEKDWYSDIWSLCGEEVPFWIVCAGGKFDLPVKWWSLGRYQEVIDHFRGQIQFVQVGNWGSYHPKLEGAIDLRGRTSIRDLIHLMYYAQGVLCGVTSIMHLAAAVPTESGKAREAVIVAGAREPDVWEKYPGHRYVSSGQEVSCGNCWKHRHIPLPDRGRNHSRAIRCSNVRNSLPECMDVISAERVIGEIKACKVPTLTRAQFSLAEKAISKAREKSEFDLHNIHPLNAVSKAERFIAEIPPYDRRRFSGRGIVLCGGGVSYFTNAWVCVQMLRFHGCKLPVELWYLGRSELDGKMESLIAPLGVTCVNAHEFMGRHPMRNPLGWELKSYALLHSRFREVSLLDADNVAVRNPEFLFDTPEFARTGAIFWPDYLRLGRHRAAWKMCGVSYRDEPEFESGQMVVDKHRCWKAVNLAYWYNDHSEFFYQYFHGDKETFHMAWRRLNQEYSMVPHAIESLPGTMCQHDFRGRRLFQHRNLAKWSLWGENPRISGFLYENECLNFLESLRTVWDGRIGRRRETVSRYGFSFRKGTCDEVVFRSVTLENEYALPESFEAEDVVLDVGAHIGSFAAACHARGSRSILCYEANRENTRIARANLQAFPGIKLMNKAVLNREGRVRVSTFPPEAAGQNTGGGRVFLDETGEGKAVSFDALLRKHRRIRLVKLDCEGSEWPILLTSRELHRVEEICGEYHEMDEHPLCPGAAPLDGPLIKRILSAHFDVVRTQLDRANPKLGKFWASRKVPVHAPEFRDTVRQFAAPPPGSASEPARAVG
jgi:FkbM family methyltransferase